VDSRQLPPFNSILTTALILFGIGAVGLTLIFILTVPTLGPRWLMFFLAPFVFTGIAMPFVWLLNRRLAVRFSTSGTIIVREALFLGIYVDLMLWLQFGKVLNFALGVFLLVGIILIEGLLRWRENSQFKVRTEE
jgi:hypothetical protein